VSLRALGGLTDGEFDPMCVISKTALGQFAVPLFEQQREIRAGASGLPQARG